jgi:hypothetical protein
MIAESSRMTFASRDKEAIHKAEDIKDKVLRFERLEYRNLDSKGE